MQFCCCKTCKFFEWSCIYMQSVWTILSHCFHAIVRIQQMITAMWAKRCVKQRHVSDREARNRCDIYVQLHGCKLGRRRSIVLLLFICNSILVSLICTCKYKCIPSRMMNRLFLRNGTRKNWKWKWSSTKCATKQRIEQIISIALHYIQFIVYARIEIERNEAQLLVLFYFLTFTSVIIF